MLKFLNLYQNIYGDDNAIYNILYKLIENSFKFTDEGFVKLMINQEKGLIKFLLQDTGIGFDKQSLSLVNDSFMHDDKSYSKNYYGLGIGLSICKQLLDRLDSKLEIESELKKGATISFKLDIINKSEQKIKSKINLDSRILIVDDRLDDIEILSELLKYYGFTNIDFSTSGYESLMLHKCKFYDLIFMDCFMPELDGFDTTFQLRMIEEKTNAHKSLIVGTSACTGEQLEKKMITSHMDDYIFKPIIFAEFEEKLEKYIEIPNSQKGVSRQEK